MKRRAAGPNPRAKHPRNHMELGRDSYVSQSGITKLLKSVRDVGIPNGLSERTFLRARKDATQRMTPYGKLVEMEELPTSNGIIKLAVQNPMAIFWESMRTSARYRSLVEQAVQRVGTTEPWGLALYNDGVSPTDSAAHHDKRKMTSFYWSLRELGQRALSTEEGWHVFTTVRNKNLEAYDGHISRFTRRIMLEKHFAHWMQSGMFLDVAGAVAPMRLCIWCFVSDLPALTDFMHSMGHNAVKPCPLCRNVILQRLYDATVHRGFITTATVDIRAFVPHTDGSLKALLGFLAAQQAVLGKTAFGELETCSGFRYHPDMLVLHPAVDLPQQLMVDYAHQYVVGGLLDHEIGQCINAVRPDPAMTYMNIGTFVQSFTWPKAIKSVPTDLFTTIAIKSHTAAGKFNSSASQLLSLAPVLGLFLAQASQHGAAGALPFIACLLACVDVVELLQLVRLGMVTEDMLKEAITTHLRMYVACYGADATRPKHHFAMHMSTMLGIFGTLLSCLVMERLHRLLQRYTLNRRNLKSYEIGCIEDITVNQLRDRKVDWMADGLLNPAAPKGRILALMKSLWPEELQYTVSRNARIQRGIISLDDVVFYVASGVLCCGRVMLLFRVCNVDRCIVSKWTRVPRPSPGHAFRFKISDDVTTEDIHDLEQIEEACIFALEGDHATVLVSPLYRGCA